MSSISKRKAGTWRIVWTAVQFNFLFWWQPVVHWATSALSLQLMALFTAFLAPPPRFCTSETAAQHPPLPFLPLWTSKLCPFLHWSCKTIWTIRNTNMHTNHLYTPHKNHGIFCFYCHGNFPRYLFLNQCGAMWCLETLKLFLTEHFQSFTRVYNWKKKTATLW